MKCIVHNRSARMVGTDLSEFEVEWFPPASLHPMDYPSRLEALRDRGAQKIHTTNPYVLDWFESEEMVESIVMAETGVRLVDHRDWLIEGEALSAGEFWSSRAPDEWMSETKRSAG